MHCFRVVIFESNKREKKRKKKQKPRTKSKREWWVRDQFQKGANSISKHIDLENKIRRSCNWVSMDFSVRSRNLLWLEHSYEKLAQSLHNNNRRTVLPVSRSVWTTTSSERLIDSRWLIDHKWLPISNTGTSVEHGLLGPGPSRGEANFSN
jgi:hypothetical protein